MIANFLIAAALLADTLACHGSHRVCIGMFSIDAPCSYRIVQTISGVDTASGYIEPSDRSWRVNWLTGMWEKMLNPTEHRRIVWKRTDTVGEARVAVGLVEEQGQRFYVVGDGWLQMRIPESVTGGLGVLKGLYSKSEVRTGGRRCDSAETPPP